MTNNVVLTAALRGSLLSLQKTQLSIDTTQLRLATGLRVNSALDNPQNFFAAEALGNRANDLQRLLDGIGQNIQVIKAADNGVTALSSLIEQAESIAQSERDALAQGSAEARVKGSRDISSATDLTQLAGINNGDALVVSVTDPDADGSLVDFDPATTATIDNLTITISTGDSIEELITKINDNNNLATPVIEASLDADGQLEIRSLNGGGFSLDFVTVGDSDAENLAFAEAIGLGEVARVIGNNNGTNNVSFTASADTFISSFEFFQDTTQTNRAVRSDFLWDIGAGSGLFDKDGNQLFDGLSTTGTTGGEDAFSISVNGGTEVRIDLAGLTIQGFIDTINQNASLSELIEADFDDNTSQIKIRSLDAEVTDITIGAFADGGDDANFGFGTRSFIGIGGTSSDQLQETIRFGKGAGRLAELELEYNAVNNQIDLLVTNGDTGYRGTNLLNGDSLVTFFNEFRSSSLITEGVNFNSIGLGLNEAKFTDENSVNLALSETRNALERVRNFGNTLANDLAIIQTRETFTKNMINTLDEGADKLTLADQNEEGAKLLAQQTRLALGITALELAANSQRSILRLF
jgi:flagellin-like hook-associated protein FlgL